MNVDRHMGGERRPEKDLVYATLIVPSLPDGCNGPSREGPAYQEKRTDLLVREAEGPERHVKVSANLTFPLGEEAYLLVDPLEAIKYRIAKGRMMGFRRLGIHQLRLGEKARVPESEKWGTAQGQTKVTGEIF